MGDKSYKIQVNFKDTNGAGTARGVSLYTCANSANLAKLLGILDESREVSSIQVVNTVTVPTLKELAPLTKDDLGLCELKKLK